MPFTVKWKENLMETFNFFAGLCSVIGFLFALLAWVYERLETKRMIEPNEKSRIQYKWIRL